MPFFNENGGTPYGSASGDKAGEFDGDNYRPDNAAQNDNVNVRARVDLAVSDAAPTPFSSGVAMFNMTIIGSTPDAGQEFVPVSAATTNRGIQWRNGGAGSVQNSIVVNTGAETGIEVDLGVTGAPGFNAIDNANNGYTTLVCSTPDDGAAPAAQETTVINNGNALNLVLGGTAAGANSVNAAGFDGPGQGRPDLQPDRQRGRASSTPASRARRSTRGRRPASSASAAARRPPGRASTARRRTAARSPPRRRRSGPPGGRP